VRDDVSCPFTVQVDTREQRPYVFSNMRTNKDKGEKLIAVPVEFSSLDTGDYSIIGLSDRIAIERKSKEDLFGSVARRDNFRGRLERMDTLISLGGYAAIMVECSLEDLHEPPPYSQLNPKSLLRTILAWRQRYRADWWFVSGRHRAEAFTFRMLERFYLAHKDSLCAQISTPCGDSSAT
jgi:hypothetical protein